MKRKPRVHAFLSGSVAACFIMACFALIYGIWTVWDLYGYVKIIFTCLVVGGIFIMANKEIK